MTLTLDKDNPLATKVQTRDGRKARLICVDVKGHGNGKLLALVEMAEREFSYHYTPEGTDPSGATTGSDLINAPVEHRRWVNWSKSGNGKPYPDGAYPTKDEADCFAKTLNIPRIACIEVVFKEGDGL